MDEQENDWSRVMSGLEALKEAELLERAGVERARSRGGEVDEEGWLALAGAVVEMTKLRPEAAQLLLDMSRLHAGVERLVEEAGLFAAVADVAVKRPGDFSERNRGFVSDLCYNHLSWEAEAAFKRDGVGGLIRVLETSALAQSRPDFTRSVVRYYVEVLLRRPEELLRLGAAFAHVEGVQRDVDRALERAKKGSKT